MEAENGPFSIVNEETCNAAFAIYPNNPQGFMERIIKLHFGHAELILNYEKLHALKKKEIETINSIFCHYFEVNLNNRLAQQATKNALAKCRCYRRHKLYQAIQYDLDGNFIAITSDGEYYFYGQDNVDGTLLSPFEDEECDEMLETTYNLDGPHGKFGIPLSYENREFIVVVEKDDDKIVITYINPQARLSDLIYSKNI
uniref:Uncharacterized protein n=1 Tax=Panagrolaimus sp. PS1159 TaxID=55785 RepID=A0AC35G8W3_9BILA